MIVTAICAVLCALTLAWVFAPRGKGLTAAFLCAVVAFGIYMAMGNPDLRGRPTPSNPKAQAEYRDLVLQEFEFRNRLSQNPDDADAMIRLAALLMTQGNKGDDVQSLLDRAKKIKPGDKRVQMVQSILNAMRKDSAEKN